MATVKINGIELQVEDNTLILDAARKAGFEIPTFCYQADLMGIGSCRMCLVEIEGQKKLQPSCVTPVLHGMSINTETPTVMSARASMLEFLLANHAMDCPVCDKGGECELQDMVHKYGPRKGRHADAKFKFHEKDYALSPVIIKNSNRCVNCMKCVRVCREVVGRNVLTALNRGDHQEATSFMRTFLDCDHDGNCIEVCPVGCFMRLPYRYKTRPWDLKGVDTICTYCATGCRMVIEHRDGTVVRAKAQMGVGINSETLCARGRFGYDIMNDDGRVKTPMIKKSRTGGLEPASWEEAIAFIKDNLATVDGEKLGGIISPRSTNEEAYLFQKLIRTIFKSPNIDSSVRFKADAVEGFVKATGMDEGGASIFDCMEADTVLIIGAHLSDENPVTDYIVRRISGSRRMNLIITSPRAMKLDSSASVVLRHLPATEGALLDAIILNLNADKIVGSEALTALKDTKLEAVLAEAGVDAETVKLISNKIAGSASVGIIAGTDFLRSPEGLPPLGLLRELLKATGKKLTVVPVLDRCNQRGVWEMGGHPNFGPGYSAVKAKGMGTEAMLDAAHSGGLEALYIAGADLVTLAEDEDFVKRALSKVGFLVVQDTFMTETARLANVVLPGVSTGEKDGMFTNQEGRAQVIKKLLPPPGKAKKDIDIIRAVGEAFERSFGPKNPALVLDEIRKEIGMYSEVSLTFKNKRNPDNELDNKAALVKGTHSDLKIGSWPRRHVAADPAFPFILTTGNQLFHSGRLSRRSEILTSLSKGAEVEISESDATALGLKAGDKVRVKGARYEAVVSLKTKKGSKPGVAFIAENYNEAPVNRFFKKGEGLPRVSITKAL